jgi:hypothetical protein
MCTILHELANQDYNPKAIEYQCFDAGHNMWRPWIDIHCPARCVGGEQHTSIRKTPRRLDERTFSKRPKRPLEPLSLLPRPLGLYESAGGVNRFSGGRFGGPRGHGLSLSRGYSMTRSLSLQDGLQGLLLELLPLFRAFSSSSTGRLEPHSF